MKTNTIENLKDALDVIYKCFYAVGDEVEFNIETYGTSMYIKISTLESDWVISNLTDNGYDAEIVDHDRNKDLHTISVDLS